MAFQGDAFQHNAFQTGGDPTAFGTPLAQASSGPSVRPLYYQALFYVAMPLAAAAVVTTVEGWQSQASAAPNRPGLTVESVTFVPSPTPAPLGWQSQANSSASLRSVALGTVAFVPISTQFTQNTQDISKWQQPLSIAAPRSPVWPGYSFVPFDTAQIIQNTITGIAWHQSLSRAVPIARPALTDTPIFVAISTQFTQNTIDISRWQQPLSIAVYRSPIREGWTFVPLNTAQFISNTQDISRWQQPASIPVRRPLSIQVDLRPFEFIPSDNNVTIDKWQQPLSPAPPQRYTSYGFIYNYLAPPQAAIVNTVTIDKWQQPLSRAVPIARSAPFDTPIFVALSTQFTQNTVDISRWQQPLSVAAPRPPVHVGYSFVPFNTAQLVVSNTVTIDKWQQPLSKTPVSIYPTRSQITFAFAPFPPAPSGWHVALSVPPPRVPLQIGFIHNHYAKIQVIFNTVTIDKWQQPLSRATNWSRIPLPEFAFVPIDLAQPPGPAQRRPLFTKGAHRFWKGSMGSTTTTPSPITPPPEGAILTEDGDFILTEDSDILVEE